MDDRPENEVSPTTTDGHAESNGAAATTGRLDPWSAVFPAASDGWVALAVAGLLFAVVFVWRVQDADPASGVASLFAAPIMVLALRFGIRGGLVGAAVAVGLIAVWDAGWNPHLDATAYATRVVTYVAVGGCVGWFSGRLRAESAERLRAERQRDVFAAELLRTEDDSRARLAADLHDDTLQGIAAALVDLDTLSGTRSPPGRRRAELRIRSTLHGTLERTRSHVFGLRPQVLEARGLGDALAGLAERSRADAGLELRVQAPSGRYPDAVERLVFRIVSEGLAHVGATPSPDGFDVVVEERDAWIDGRIHRRRPASGRGLAPAPATQSHELELLAERVRLAGGSFDAGSTPAGEAWIRFRVPIRPSRGPTVAAGEGR